MQFRCVDLVSIGPPSQKLWPNLIFAQFPSCNYKVNCPRCGVTGITCFFVNSSVLSVILKWFGNYKNSSKWFWQLFDFLNRTTVAYMTRPHSAACLERLVDKAIWALEQNVGLDGWYPLGKGGCTRSDKLLEKFQTVFDCHPPHFRKIMLQFLYNGYGCIYAWRYGGQIVWIICTWFPEIGTILVFLNTIVENTYPEPWNVSFLSISCSKSPVSISKICNTNIWIENDPPTPGFFLSKVHLFWYPDQSLSPRIHDPKS